MSSRHSRVVRDGKTAPIDLLLSRLHGVQGKGPMFMALCPAHDDRRPSLSIAVGDDGRVLIHCFAGCDATDVVAAVGLTLADLFDRPADHRQDPVPGWARWDHRLLLRLLLREMRIISIVARNLDRGRPLSEIDRARLAQARERILQVVEIAK